MPVNRDPIISLIRDFANISIEDIDNPNKKRAGFLKLTGALNRLKQGGQNGTINS